MADTERRFYTNPETGDVTRVVTYEEAASIIGVGWTNQVRQYVSRGKIRVVVKTYKPGTEIPLVLLHAEDVDKAAELYNPHPIVEGEKTRSYEAKLTSANHDLFLKTFPGVELKDLTATRRVHQKAYHQRRKIKNGK